MNKERIKWISGVGILSSILIVLQLIANYITIGPVSITLSLIPILVGCTCYGPFAGFILGLLNGIVILLGPATQALFFSQAPIGTIIVCLTKTSVAGLISGLIFKLIKNKKAGIVISSIILPIINTSLFVVLSLIFFIPIIEPLSNGENILSYLLFTFIGYNFLIELFVNSVLSIASYRIYKQFINKKES